MHWTGSRMTSIRKLLKMKLQANSPRRETKMLPKMNALKQNNKRAQRIQSDSLASTLVCSLQILAATLQARRKQLEKLVTAI